MGTRTNPACLSDFRADMWGCQPNYRRAASRHNAGRQSSILTEILTDAVPFPGRVALFNLVFPLHSALHAMWWLKSASAVNFSQGQTSQVIDFMRIQAWHEGCISLWQEVTRNEERDVDSGSHGNGSGTDDGLGRDSSGSRAGRASLLRARLVQPVLGRLLGSWPLLRVPECRRGETGHEGKGRAGVRGRLLCGHHQREQDHAPAAGQL